MAARLLGLRRALSLCLTNQKPRLPLFKGRLSQPKSLLNRDYAYVGLLNRQFCVSRETSEAAAATVTSNSSNTVAELSKSPSTPPATAAEEMIVKYKSQLKINPRHDFMMVFTCKVCETRSMKMASRESYEKGVVVVRCEGCDNLHLIADRLGWFGEPGSVEELLAARGDEFKKGSMDSLSLTVDDLAGKKISDE
ncbi:Zim17-type zinc finger protein [Hirschfeldia incana]|nr:Zim17-type zinc finger protein [Hirschfeldia incana]